MSASELSGSLVVVYFSCLNLLFCIACDHLTGQNIPLSSLACYVLFFFFFFAFVTFPNGVLSLVL